MIKLFRLKPYFIPTIMESFEFHDINIFDISSFDSFFTCDWASTIHLNEV